jgi:preprotein translocase subunit YajC
VFDQVPLTLAQEDAAPAPAAPAAPQQNAPGENAIIPPKSDPNASGAQPPGFPMEMIFMFFLIIVAMMIFSNRSQKKERKKRDQMIASMKKGMKVQTVGGIIGSVVEVRDDVVILKVDENVNTRIKFTRSSIQSITEDKDNG